jgi:hypothetical protein
MPQQDIDMPLLRRDEALQRGDSQLERITPGSERFHVTRSGGRSCLFVRAGPRCPRRSKLPRVHGSARAVSAFFTRTPRFHCSIRGAKL